MSTSMTEVERFTSEPENMRLYQQERVILETSDLISDLLDRTGITKAELAERLGRSKSYVTQLLNGRANMTLRTISDVMWALDSNLEISAAPLSIHSSGTADMQDVIDGQAIPWMIFESPSSFLCAEIPIRMDVSVWGRKLDFMKQTDFGEYQRLERAEAGAGLGQARFEISSLADAMTG